MLRERGCDTPLPPQRSASAHSRTHRAQAPGCTTCRVQLRASDDEDSLSEGVALQASLALPATARAAGADRRRRGHFSPRSGREQQLAETPVPRKPRRFYPPTRRARARARRKAGPAARGGSAAAASSPSTPSPAGRHASSHGLACCAHASTRSCRTRRDARVHAGAGPSQYVRRRTGSRAQRAKVSALRTHVPATFTRRRRRAPAAGVAVRVRAAERALRRASHSEQSMARQGMRARRCGRRSRRPHTQLPPPPLPTGPGRGRDQRDALRRGLRAQHGAVRALLGPHRRGGRRARHVARRRARRGGDAGALERADGARQRRQQRRRLHVRAARHDGRGHLPTLHLQRRAAARRVGARQHHRCATQHRASEALPAARARRGGLLPRRGAAQGRRWAARKWWWPTRPRRRPREWRTTTSSRARRSRAASARRARRCPPRGSGTGRCCARRRRGTASQTTRPHWPATRRAGASLSDAKRLDCGDQGARAGGR